MVTATNTTSAVVYPGCRAYQNCRRYGDVKPMPAHKEDVYKTRPAERSVSLRAAITGHLGGR